MFNVCRKSKFSNKKSKHQCKNNKFTRISLAPLSFLSLHSPSVSFSHEHCSPVSVKLTFICSRLNDPLPVRWLSSAGVSVTEVWWRRLRRCDELDDEDLCVAAAAAAAAVAAEVRWVCCSRANITCRSRWNWDMATLIRTLLKMIITDGTISVISVSALLIDVTRRTYFSDTCSSSRITVHLRTDHPCYVCW